MVRLWKCALLVLLATVNLSIWEAATEVAAIMYCSTSRIQIKRLIH